MVTLTILVVGVMVVRLDGVDGLWDASSRFGTLCFIVPFFQTPEAQALTNGSIVSVRAAWERALPKLLRTGPRAAVLQCVHCLSCFWLPTIRPGGVTSGRLSTRSEYTILFSWLNSVNSMTGSLVLEIGRIGSNHIGGGARDAYTS